jgi:hypothetical protein
MSDLQAELQGRIGKLKWKGKQNYLLAYFLYASAGVASAAATVWTAVLVASRSAPSLWLAVLASAPGAAVILNETLKPELKARWCYEKRAALEALLRGSRYANVPDADTVAKWNELEIRLEREWPRFGTIAAKPTRGKSVK